MPRTKKQLENNFAEDSHLNLTEPVEIVTNEQNLPDQDEPIAEETHRVVRTWKKKVLVEPQIIEVAGSDEEFTNEKSLDPLDEFLAEVGATSSETVSMTIWRLPNYWKDSNASPSAEKICLDTLTWDRDTYVKTIQERFVRRTKHNDFLIAIRRNGRIRAYLPILRLEADQPEPADAETAQENDVISPGVVRDPVQDFDKMVRNMKRWNESLGIVTGMQAQPTAPPEPPEISTDQALLKLATEDPETLARIRDRIFGRDNPGSEPESVWTPLIKEIAPAAPLILQALLQWLMGQAQTNAAPTPPGQIQIMSPPVIPPAEPSPPPPAQPAASTVNAYHQILGRMLQAIELGITPQFIANEIQSAWQQDATLAPLLDSVLTMPPPELLQGLASLSLEAKRVCELPTALDWLTELQSQFAEEDEAPTPQETAA